MTDTVLDTPPPVLSPSQVDALLRECWGVVADSIRPLASERDVNLMVDGRYVLKVSNPAEDPQGVDMENLGMAHAARACPVPTVVPTTAGSFVARVVDGTGRECLARLITVAPGSPAEGRPITLGLAEQIGAVAARTSLALQGLFHRAGDRTLDWDVRRAPEVLSAPGALEAMAMTVGVRVRRRA